MIASTCCIAIVCAACWEPLYAQDDPKSDAAKMTVRMREFSDPLWSGTAGLHKDLTDFVDTFQVYCRLGQVPLSDDQLRPLRESVRPILTAAIRNHEDEIWLMFWDDLMPEPREKSIGRYRLQGAIYGRPLGYPFAFEKQMFPIFRRVATAEQIKAADELLTHPRYTQAIVDKLADFNRQLASADKVRDALRRGSWDVDETGPTEPRDVPPADMASFIDSYMKSQTQIFIRLHELSDKQRTAAEAIRDDLKRRRTGYEAAHKAEYERCWRQFVEAVAYPKESKISRRAAIRALRKSIDAAFRPFREEMARRLETLLTREQRAAAKTWETKKPEWLQIIEQVQREKEEAEKRAATSRPTCAGG